MTATHSDIECGKTERLIGLLCRYPLLFIDPPGATKTKDDLVPEAQSAVLGPEPSETSSQDFRDERRRGTPASEFPAKRREVITMSRKGGYGQSDFNFYDPEAFDDFDSSALTTSSIQGKKIVNKYRFIPAHLIHLSQVTLYTPLAWFSQTTLRIRLKNQ